MHRILLSGVAALVLVAIAAGVPGKPVAYNRVDAKRPVCLTRMAMGSQFPASRAQAVVDVEPSQLVIPGKPGRLQRLGETCRPD